MKRHAPDVIDLTLSSATKKLKPTPLRQAQLTLTTQGPAIDTVKKRQKQPVLRQAQILMTERGPVIARAKNGEEEEGGARPVPSLEREALQCEMARTVADQLERYSASHPLECAFNATHRDEPFKVAHYVKYFDELCEQFLAEHATLIDPMDEQFREAWRLYHASKAQLRILCAHCDRMVRPRYLSGCAQRAQEEALGSKKTRQKSVNEVLVPSREEERTHGVAHPWLDLLSWGPPNARGNYRRTLGELTFTIYATNGKWSYAYNNEFGRERYATVEEALAATYAQFREAIHRHV